MKRNTTLRDKHRRQIAADKPPCHICGEVIDYALPYLHPMSFVVDHVMPLARGGADALPNKKAAHRQRACNRTKGDRLAGETSHSSLKIAAPTVRDRLPVVRRGGGPVKPYRRHFSAQAAYPPGHPRPERSRPGVVPLDGRQAPLSAEAALTHRPDSTEPVRMPRAATSLLALRGQGMTTVGKVRHVTSLALVSCRNADFRP